MSQFPKSVHVVGVVSTFVLFPLLATAISPPEYRREAGALTFLWVAGVWLWSWVSRALASGGQEGATDMGVRDDRWDGMDLRRLAVHAMLPRRLPPDGPLPPMADALVGIQWAIRRTPALSRWVRKLVYVLDPETQAVLAIARSYQDDLELVEERAFPEKLRGNEPCLVTLSPPGLATYLVRWRQSVPEDYYEEDFGGLGPAYGSAAIREFEEMGPPVEGKVVLAALVESVSPEGAARELELEWDPKPGLEVLSVSETPHETKEQFQRFEPGAP